MLADIPTLTCILKSHVIGGSIPSADVTTGPVTSLSGHDLAAVVSDGTVSFDDAKVVAADIEASNGIIHVIDSVIVPESCVSPADEPVDAPATTTAAAPTSKPTLHDDHDSHDGDHSDHSDEMKGSAMGDTSAAASSYYIATTVVAMAAGSMMIA